MDQNTVLVSVCMITYNHEKYISKAIDSILSQQTNFLFELVILDDNSPDNTRQIVLDFINFHSKGSLIKYEKNNVNIGVMPNFKKALLSCKGKYIALCEGDDYWINNSKLQVQVDLLGKNNGCSFAFHKAYKITELNTLNLNDFFPLKVEKEVLDAKDFFDLGGKATSSILFKNVVSFDFLDLSHSHGDFLLYLTLLDKGNCVFVDKIMSVYRIHPGGVSYNKGSFVYLKTRISELETELNYFSSSKIKNEVRRQIVKHVFLFLKSNYKILPKKEIFRYFFKVRFSREFYFYLLHDLRRMIETKITKTSR